MGAVYSENSRLKSPFFLDNKDKTVCLICTDTVSVFKECKIKRHCDARHKEKYDVFEGQVRADKSKRLQRALFASRIYSGLG
jgi:hypothetical protein